MSLAVMATEGDFVCSPRAKVRYSDEVREAARREYTEACSACDAIADVHSDAAQEADSRYRAAYRTLGIVEGWRHG